MALRSKCSFINIIKRRSDRQSSVTVTGVTVTGKTDSSTVAMLRSGQAADRESIRKAGRVKRVGSKRSES